MDLPTRARTLASALAQVHDAARSGPLQEALQGATGHSLPILRQGLEDTFAPLTESALLQAGTQLNDAGLNDAGLNDAGFNNTHHHFINLAGNVFIAGVHPILTGLLAGASVVVRTSERAGHLERALKQALGDALPLHVCTFASSDQAAFETALRDADVVEVYGRDDTVARLRELTEVVHATRPPKQPPLTFIGRGHGLGIGVLGDAAYIPGSTYDHLARDVAAFDQRGCLSPRVVYAAGNLAHHAERIHRALARVHQTQPRSPLPPSVATESTQWRHTAAALLPIQEGPGHTLVTDPTGRFPIGPTDRHLLLRPLTNADLPFQPRHVKVIGHAGLTAERREALQQAFPDARLCPLGAMQRPPFGSPADGYPFGYGFLRS